MDNTAALAARFKLDDRRKAMLPGIHRAGTVAGSKYGAVNGPGDHTKPGKKRPVKFNKYTGKEQPDSKNLAQMPKKPVDKPKVTPAIPSTDNKKKKFPNKYDLTQKTKAPTAEEALGVKKNLKGGF